MAIDQLNDVYLSEADTGFGGVSVCSQNDHGNGDVLNY